MEDTPARERHQGAVEAQLRRLNVFYRWDRVPLPLLSSTSYGSSPRENLTAQPPPTEALEEPPSTSLVFSPQVSFPVTITCRSSRRKQRREPGSERSNVFCPDGNRSDNNDPYQRADLLGGEIGTDSSEGCHEPSSTIIGEVYQSALERDIERDIHRVGLFPAHGCFSAPAPAPAVYKNNKKHALLEKKRERQAATSDDDGGSDSSGGDKESGLTSVHRTCVVPNLDGDNDLRPEGSHPPSSDGLSHAEDGGEAEAEGEEDLGIDTSTVLPRAIEPWQVSVPGDGSNNDGVDATREDSNANDNHLFAVCEPDGGIGGDSAGNGRGKRAKAMELQVSVHPRDASGVRKPRSRRRVLLEEDSDDDDETGNAMERLEQPTVLTVPTFEDGVSFETSPPVKIVGATAGNAVNILCRRRVLTDSHEDAFSDEEGLGDVTGDAELPHPPRHGNAERCTSPKVPERGPTVVADNDNGPVFQEPEPGDILLASSSADSQSAVLDGRTVFEIPTPSPVSVDKTGMDEMKADRTDAFVESDNSESDGGEGEGSDLSSDATRRYVPSSSDEEGEVESREDEIYEIGHDSRSNSTCPSQTREVPIDSAPSSEGEETATPGGNGLVAAADLATEGSDDGNEFPVAARLSGRGHAKSMPRKRHIKVICSYSSSSDGGDDESGVLRHETAEEEEGGGEGELEEEDFAEVRSYSDKKQQEERLRLSNDRCRSERESGAERDAGRLIPADGDVACSAAATAATTTTTTTGVDGGRRVSVKSSSSPATATAAVAARVARELSVVKSPTTTVFGWSPDCAKVANGDVGGTRGAELKKYITEDNNPQSHGMALLLGMMPSNQAKDAENVASDSGNDASSECSDECDSAVADDTGRLMGITTPIVNQPRKRCQQRRRRQLSSGSDSHDDESEQEQRAIRTASLTTKTSGVESPLEDTMRSGECKQQRHQKHQVKQQAHQGQLLQARRLCQTRKVLYDSEHDDGVALVASPEELSAKSHTFGNPRRVGRDKVAVEAVNETSNHSSCSSSTDECREFSRSDEGREAGGTCSQTGPQTLVVEEQQDSDRTPECEPSLGKQTPTPVGGGDSSPYRRHLAVPISDENSLVKAGSDEWLLSTAENNGTSGRSNDDSTAASNPPRGIATAAAEEEKEKQSRTRRGDRKQRRVLIFSDEEDENTDKDGATVAGECSDMCSNDFPAVLSTTAGVGNDGRTRRPVMTDDDLSCTETNTPVMTTEGTIVPPRRRCKTMLSRRTSMRAEEKKGEKRRGGKDGVVGVGEREPRTEEGATATTAATADTTSGGGDGYENEDDGLVDTDTDSDSSTPPRKQRTAQAHPPRTATASNAPLSTLEASIGNSEYEKDDDDEKEEDKTAKEDYFVPSGQGRSARKTGAAGAGGDDLRGNKKYRRTASASGLGFAKERSTGDERRRRESPSRFVKGSATVDSSLESSGLVQEDYDFGDDDDEDWSFDSFTPKKGLKNSSPVVTTSSTTPAVATDSNAADDATLVAKKIVGCGAVAGRRVFSPINKAATSDARRAKRSGKASGKRSNPERCMTVSTQGEATGSSFFKTRDSLTSKYFAEFNEGAFGGALSGVAVSWSGRLRRTAGVTKSRRERGSSTFGGGGELVYVSEVELSSKVVDSEAKLRETLLHELCHAAAWVIDHNANPPHGPHFKTWANRAKAAHPGIPVTTCHSYEINYKYRYLCVGHNASSARGENVGVAGEEGGEEEGQVVGVQKGGCGAEIGRHSKSINVANQVCGRCKGRLVLLGTHGRDGTLKKPRVASGFSLFVKEHYAQVKKGMPTGTKQQQVMKEISRLWTLRDKGDSLAGERTGDADQTRRVEKENAAVVVVDLS